MSATATQPRTRDPRVLLDGAVTAMSVKRRAEVDVLEAALAWARAHTVEAGERAEGWRSDAVHAPGSVAALFGEQAVPIAGAGTPLLAEFATAELAAALHITHDAALALLGDVLDLAHRLPRLWALVRALKVPVYVARRAAQESRDLTPDAADHADRLLVWQPRRLNPHRVGVLVHEARLYADPDRALDLLAVDPTDPDRPDPKDDPAVCVAEEAMYARRTPFRGRAGDATIVFHVIDRDLLAHPDQPGVGGVATSTGLGPVLMTRLARWLAGADQVTIKPVLDPSTIPAVDAHDPPARMAQAVRFRDPTCVFPRCGTPAEACDLDHIDPHVAMDQGGHRARPASRSSRRCADATTAPRPSATSPTDACPTGRTSGPCPPAGPSPRTRPPHDPAPARIATNHHPNTAADNPTRPAEPATHEVSGPPARPDRHPGMPWGCMVTDRGISVCFRRERTLRSGRDQAARLGCSPRRRTRRPGGVGRVGWAGGVG